MDFVIVGEFSNLYVSVSMILDGCKQVMPLYNIQFPKFDLWFTNANVLKRKKKKIKIE